MGLDVELAFVDDVRQLHAGWFDPPFRFDSPFSGAEFALLLACERAADASEMTAIATDVLGQGCRSVTCVGAACEAWRAAFVEADRRLRLQLPPRSVPGFQSSSHAGETTSEVASHFATLTFFDDFLPRRFLLLFVDHGAGRDELALVRLRKAIVEEMRRAS